MLVVHVSRSIKPESSTRRPDQEIDVKICNATKQAATTCGDFLGCDLVLKDERALVRNRVFVSDMESIRFESQWEALLMLFGEIGTIDEMDSFESLKMHQPTTITIKPGILL